MNEPIEPTPMPPGTPGPLAPGEERTWSLAAHLGALVLGLLAPLLVMLIQGPKSSFVRANAVESLNFQLSLLIVGVPLTLVTCGFGAVIFIVAIVFEVIGGIKANEGVVYRYPLNIRLVK